ncbi:NADH-quinone oxidoreductase subunit N [Thermosulfuriphilus sp.]
MWSSIPSFSVIYPEALLVTVASAMVLLDRFIREKMIFVWMGLGAVVLALTLTFSTSGASFAGVYSADPYSFFFRVIFLLVLTLVILLSPGYTRDQGINFGEYYGMLFFAVVGMIILASAKDMILVYLGLELMSLSVYVLVAFLHPDLRSLEGAIKYFLLGCFASAFLLLAMTFIYGLTTSTNLEVIAQRLMASDLPSSKALLFSVALFVVALGFKIAAIPFHMWAPDAYEGAPTSITAFMSVGPKAAAFAAMGRVFMTALFSARADWTEIIIPLAMVTMIGGAILALVQTNIKRLLAYSSIANAGCALLGLIAGSADGLAAMMAFLAIYAFMNLGVFGVVLLLSRRDRAGESIFDYQGLARSHPWAAFMMLIFLFSLGGIPPTAGFVGKFYLFKVAFEAGYVALVIMAALTSIVGAYPYVRLVLLMYMKEPQGEVSLNLTGYLLTGLAISLLGVLAFGLFPAPLIEFARSCVFHLP